MVAALCVGCTNESPNVVLITVDTLRADRLGAYGYPESTSPKVDELAKHGVLFSKASTVIPRTTQSVATLFTGLYPYQHGVLEVGEPLGREQLTLAEILREAGYRTIGISSNPVAGAMQNLDQGFDVFLDRDQLSERHPIWRPTDGDPAAGGVGPAEAVTREALSQLARHPKGPYFLWLLYLDPHWAYHPPPPYDQVVDWNEFTFYRAIPPEHRRAVVYYNLDGESARFRAGSSRLYDAEVRYTDWAIGQLLDAVRERSDGKRTLVVFTADHGESLGEHGYYYSHGDLVHEPSMRVPLIFSWPGSLPEGVRVEAPVSSVDVAPTILGLLGIEAEGLAGEDLGGALRETARVGHDRVVFGENAAAQLAENPIRALGGRRSPRKIAFRYARQNGWQVVVTTRGQTRLYRPGEDPFLRHDVADRFPERAASMRAALLSVPFLDLRMRMARNERFKLIRIPELDGARFELYDLQEDPGETRDVSSERPEVVGRLRAPLERHRSETLAHATSARRVRSPQVESQVLEHLRSLGYAD